MHAQYNRFELETFAKSAADAYLQGGADLNDSITKMAQENEFSHHHVDRVVQNANIMVNGSLVNSARSSGQDPRVTFPLAKSAEVMNRMGSDTHKLADMRKEAEVINLFQVSPVTMDKEALLDGTVGAKAPDPYAAHAKSVDHMKLASDFVHGTAEAKEINAASLALASRTLENLEHRALTEHSLAKEAMDLSEQELCQEINDQILYGSSPATVRDVIKNADLNKVASEFVDKLVTKVASGLQVREGTTAFVSGSLVNPEHALIQKSAAIMGHVQDAVRTKRGLDKLASAHKTAHQEYARAVREGR
jgi:hypothetical protein